MKESRAFNEYYQAIADELIEENEAFTQIRDADLTILLLESDKEKKHGSGRVFGECEKVPDKYKWAIPADFTIVIYQPSTAGMTEEQMKILIYHELLHVGVNEKNGDAYTKPHDLEDFREIVEKYGPDWSDH